jgi:hypothetical protein
MEKIREKVKKEKEQKRLAAIEKIREKVKKEKEQKRLIEQKRLAEIERNKPAYIKIEERYKTPENMLLVLFKNNPLIKID